MADGRQLIEDTRSIILEIAGRRADLESAYSNEELAEFTLYIESAEKWVGLCRRKVWLRGKEGTDLAQECLAAANELEASLDSPAAAVDAAADVSTQLEALARVISTKSQILT